MDVMREYAKSASVMKWTREEITEYQNKKLSELLFYVYKNSTYYKSVIDSLDKDISAITLEDLPTMNKATLFEHYDEIVCNHQIHQEELSAYEGKMYLEKYTVVHSSGSSGTPRYYLYDQEACQKICLALFRVFCGASLRTYDEVIEKVDRVLLIAALDGAFGGAVFTGMALEKGQIKCDRLSIQEPLEHWRKYLDKKPKMIVAYASALKILLELDYEFDYPLYQIVSAGEPLSLQLRMALEEKFHCPVINLYCSSESMLIGMECNRFEDVYLMEDFVYTEILDGKLYITNLYNFDQPIIRYYLGDAVREAGVQENQSFAFKRIKAPQGRDEEVMWFTKESSDKKEKDFIHPLSVDVVEQAGLIDYQFVKESKQTFKIIFSVTNRKYETSVSRAIQNMVDGVLKSKKMDYVHYSLKCVDYIPVDVKTGKKKLVRIESE